jgi:hypothetical protein
MYYPRSSTKTMVTSKSFSYHSVNKWYLICSLVITNAFISRQLLRSAQDDTCLRPMSIHVFVVHYVSISHNPIKARVDAKELFHLYIVLWIEDKCRMLLGNCRLNKVRRLFSICSRFSLFHSFPKLHASSC